MKAKTKYATCVNCGEDYNYKRKELGYATCLDCGQASASRIIQRRTRENLREMAPNSFTGSVEELFDEREK
jgi:predicted  nucleic acid-binding Zn-ribbon protein